MEGQEKYEIQIKHNQKSPAQWVEDKARATKVKLKNTGKVYRGLEGESGSIEGEPLALKQLLQENNLRFTNWSEREEMIKQLKDKWMKLVSFELNPEANVPYVTIHISNSDTFGDIKNKISDEIKIDSDYIKLSWPGESRVNNDTLSLSNVKKSSVTGNQLKNLHSKPLSFNIDLDKLAAYFSERRLAFSKSLIPGKERDIQKLSGLPDDILQKIGSDYLGGKKKRKTKRKSKKKKTKKRNPTRKTKKRKSKKRRTKKRKSN